ncbi:cell morphogenesis N-terminal-domain-containing protein [Suillus tomentosus]|nr:cell morphogenesis N-terminal-domain-containing protein [Suillus tomentosus]
MASTRQGVFVPLNILLPKVFQVEKRTLEVEADEDGSGSESDGDSESDSLSSKSGIFTPLTPELKRDGHNVLSSVWAEMLYDKSSTSLAGAILPQSEFVPKLIQNLQEDPDTVVADFEELRKYLTDPTGVRISVTGNVLDIPKPRSVWSKHFGDLLPESKLAPLKLTSHTLSELGKNPATKAQRAFATVVSLPTIESSFVNHTTKAIRGFDHPEFPALWVALEVLNAKESFLWHSIRGSGLAHGAYITVDREAGLLTFSLYRSSNSLEAFKQAKEVVSGLVDGTVALEETALDAATSSIVYGVTKNVATAGRAAINSFTNQALRGVPQDRSLQMLEKYQEVAKADVLAALEKHILAVFDSKRSMVTVVTAPSKADEIAAGLTGYGFHNAFALSLGSRPRALLARLTQSFHCSEPNADERVELQQRTGPSPFSRPSPPVVEVPALDDKKIRLFGGYVLNGCNQDGDRRTFAASRVNQELAKEGIPLSFGNKFWASNWPTGKSPLPGLIIHLIPSVIIIVAPPPNIVYPFILDGLFYLRWKKPDAVRPFKVWWPLVIFFLAAAVFLLVAPFLRPPGGVGDTPPLPYYLYFLVGIVIMLAGVLSWAVWRIVLPKVFGYELVPRKEKLDDGTIVAVFKRPDLKLLAQSANHRLNAELCATLLGHLANVRFVSVTDRFLGELEPVANGQVAKDFDRYEHLLGMASRGIRGRAEFLEFLVKSFANAHDLRFKIAFADTLTRLLHPIGKTAQAKVNHPQWEKAIERIYPRAKEMTKKDPSDSYLEWNRSIDLNIPVSMPGAINDELHQVGLPSQTYIPSIFHHEEHFEPFICIVSVEGWVKGTLQKPKVDITADVEYAPFRDAAVISISPFPSSWFSQLLEDLNHFTFLQSHDDAWSKSEFPGSIGRPRRQDPAAPTIFGVISYALRFIRNMQTFLVAIENRDNYALQRLSSTLRFDLLAGFFSRWNSACDWFILRKSDETVEYQNLAAARKSDRVLAMSAAYGTRKPVASFKGHTSSNSSLAWTHDGTRLLTGGSENDPTIREWDTKTWKQVDDPWTGHTNHIQAIAIHPAGTLVASASSDNHSISIQPSLTGYISKGIALCGKGRVLDARAAFDVASMYTDQDSEIVHFLLLIEAIALFNANQHDKARLLLTKLATGCRNAGTLARDIVQAYLHAQQKALDGARYDEAADHFTAGIDSCDSSSKSNIHEIYQDLVVLFGWDLKSSWQKARQKRCNALLRAGKLQDAMNSYQHMMTSSDEITNADCLYWSNDFKQQCSALCATNGEAAFAASDYDKAIDLYSMAIDLDSASHIFFASRSQAK